MIQSSSLSRPHLYDQSFTPAKKLMLTAIPAIHSNLNLTSLFPTSKYGKITGKLVHSNHFFKVQRKRFQLDQPSPMGGIEPDLNGFSASTIVIAPLVPFEQHRELPPLNPATDKKIDHHKIHTGFGGGARRAEGAVGVEFESNCSRATVSAALFTEYCITI